MGKTNYSKFTIDPRTRYKNIPSTSKDEKIIALYDTDNKEEMRYLEEKFKSKSYFDSLAYQNIMRRYKAIKSPFKRQVSFAWASKVMRVLGKKTSRARENVMQKLGKIQNPFSRQNSAFPVILLLTKRNETFLSRNIFKLEIETSKNSVIY